MGPLTPGEILETISNSSVGKAGGRAGKLFLLAILAGVYIALGAQGSNIAACNFFADPATYGLGRLIAACVFPIGLTMVVLCGAELFTGNCLMLTGVLDKKIRISGLLRNWVIVYIGNLVGSVLIVMIMYYSGLFENGADMLGAVTVKIAATKTGLSFGKAFLLGIACNWLVCLAVWMATGAPSVPGKIMAIFLCIGLFVVCGFEHSVANMYFIPAGILASANETFVQLSGADISNLTWGGLAGNLIPVTLGNIVGGSVMVGAAYWLALKKL
ncbi:MAG: formate/nitrite transporter family protein [Bacillota bacterium]|nr:formate/nitrite transporter family protein [Bacillota bacterium]